ncbi:hypothetical protein AVEN_115162-1 [Araneus ventricosus]|uniref:Uncharacterized protein n=1 Tax=Araneus ventricosus TaxID=182803 RepID=A0A4Y1ZYB3_ARAVE|nr:hypothetical protein AVEN_115162-1 [Araneus ventricosus]
MLHRLHLQTLHRLLRIPIATTNAESISSYMLKNDVLVPAILWSLKCINSRYSYNFCEENNKIFEKMFKDNLIAKQFSCGATKTEYVCCFRLAPYFKATLIKCLHNVEQYTVLFDETLNKASQLKQMDILVRFFYNDQIVTRYLTSAFIGHAKADDILSAFYECVEKLKLSKILQISMDGPNVNWKFFENLQADLKKEYSHETLSIRCCGLHILHNSFKYGESSTGWNISEILTSLCWLFKDSPARRQDFLMLSTLKKFPLKFCKVRWLENVPAVERAIEIWPDVVSYVQNVEKGVFFTNKSKSDAPLLPFFLGDILILCKHLVEYINVYKPEYNFSSAIKLWKFDFTDEGLLHSVGKVSMGFAADNIVKQLVKRKDSYLKGAFNVKSESRSFVTKLLYHLMRKCPINYAFVRNSLCFDPGKMAPQPENCVKSLKQLLMHLSQKKIVLDTDCDDIIFEYKKFLQNIVNMYPSVFQTFKPNTRLDIFFKEYMSKSVKDYNKIWPVMKIIFTLSHGQASIECGISTNKKIEVENMALEYYVARHIVCDASKSYGQILNIPISVCSESFGIHVAKLAAFPEKVIKCSEKKLKELEELDIPFEEVSKVFAHIEHGESLVKVVKEILPYSSSEFKESEGISDSKEEAMDVDESNDTASTSQLPIESVTLSSTLETSKKLVEMLEQMEKDINQD